MIKGLEITELLPVYLSRNYNELILTVFISCIYEDESRENFSMIDTPQQLIKPEIAWGGRPKELRSEIYLLRSPFEKSILNILCWLAGLDIFNYYCNYYNLFWLLPMSIKGVLYLLKYREYYRPIPSVQPEITTYLLG